MACLATSESRSGGARPLAIATLLGVGLSATVASADLFDDADMLYARLSKHYSVRRLAPRLLERGESLPVAIDIPEASLPNSGCATVVVLGSPNAAFVLRMSEAGSAAGRVALAWETESVAGLAYVMRCGTRRRELRNVSVQMRSNRAVVERLLVKSEVPLPPAFHYLPSREPGPPLPDSQAPIRVSGIPRQQRIAAAKQSYIAAGAAEVEPLTFEGSASGAGDLLLPFEPGCYRLKLFATEYDRSHQLQAELSWPKGDGPESRDRLESIDVELRACVARTVSAHLRFVGGSAGQALVALRARFPLPRGFFAHWGAEGAAALSLALHEQQAAPFQGVPVFDSLGTGGATALHLEVIPGACYVAAVAPLREMSAPLILAAQIGSEHRQNSSPAQGVGTALAFCAGARDSVMLEVESSPRESMWLLGVWQSGSETNEGPGE